MENDGTSTGYLYTGLVHIIFHVGLPRSGTAHRMRNAKHSE